MMASAYAKLIYMPRPVSNRRKMDVGHRAKQFAPFAALRGFEEWSGKKRSFMNPERNCLRKRSRNWTESYSIFLQVCGFRQHILSRVWNFREKESIVPLKELWNSLICRSISGLEIRRYQFQILQICLEMCLKY